MRRFPSLLLMIGLLGLFSISCDSTNDEKGTVTLTGQVLDSETNNPVANAVIRIPATEAFNRQEPDVILVETDELGQFSVPVRIEFTADLLIVATKDGFTTDQVTVLAIAGRSIEVPKLRILQTRKEDPASGSPSNLLLLSQSSSAIGVIESGSIEVASITFQVADSAGNPVNLDNSTLVRFSFGQQPGGNEFIAPTEAATDNNGIVTVNLSSGTKAGAVQIIAETTTSDGRTIRSKPVGVSIHGGLPDQTHFTLGPERYNFPGLLRSGITNPVSVIVGDKYANPVRPGTSVYFTTTHGVIEGSIGTNNEGRGTVNLISANPLPPDGVAMVEAETANDVNARVSSRFPVLFSGFIVIRVTPANAVLGQTYALEVTDQNGNPLAAGTSISVVAEGTKVKAVGNTDVTLDDTVFLACDPCSSNDILKGPGITEFTFRAVEDLRIDEDGSPTLETIKVRVTGPNGSLEVVMTAGGSIVPRTAGATVEMLPEGHALIRSGQ